MASERDGLSFCCLAQPSLFLWCRDRERKKTRSFSMRMARPYITALFLRRENEHKRLMAMFTVDHEIGIKRQHRILIVNFGHPYDTRVGERHWPISIFLMQLAQGGNVLIDAERNPEGTIFKKVEQSMLCAGKPGEQVHCFRQNRFTHE